MIIRFNKNIYDFEGPYFFTDNQFENFEKGMKEIFGSVVTLPIIEKKKKMGHITRADMHSYTIDDIKNIINNNSIDESAEIIGVSSYAILNMQLLRKEYVDFLIKHNFEDNDENQTKFAEEIVK